MNNKENKLQVKDLIMIGVFSALYFLFNMVGGIPFAMNPVLTFYQPMGSAFLSGIIFMFLIAKAPKKGTISILAIIMCILFKAGNRNALGYGGRNFNNRNSS